MEKHRTTKRGGWQQWTPSQARGELKGWRASGLPLATYARQRGISAQRLRWWRDRRAEWQEGRASGGEPHLVPAVVTGKSAAATTPVVMLHLPGGVALEVVDTTAVSPAWVAAVVSALTRAG